MHAGLRIIREEHRALGAVTDGMIHLINAIEAGLVAPDFTLLGAILDYIENFPDRLHHPKEDQVLFPAVRRRTAELDQVIAELERDHEHGPKLNAAMRQSLARWQVDPKSPGTFPELARKYARLYWDHMGREEKMILQRLNELLTPEDWVEIDRAFADNNDPLIEPQATASFDALFQHIVRIMPAPYGLG